MTTTLDLPHIASDDDFREAVLACDKLLTQKGHDYTQGRSQTVGDDRGRLFNFYKNSESLGISPFLVLGVYMNKHLDAINTFIAKGGLKTESEPVETRIYDAINYLLLLAKMVKTEKRQQLGNKVVGP
jgi:hypothetical protein